MTVTIELTAREEANLRRRAAQAGEDEQAVASRLLSGLLADEEDEPKDVATTRRSMADRFMGRAGVAAGPGEAFSEDGGRRFTEHLTRKHRRAGGET